MKTYKLIAIPVFVTITGTLWYQNSRQNSVIIRGEDAAAILNMAAERLYAYKTYDTSINLSLKGGPTYLNWAEPWDDIRFNILAGPFESQIFWLDQAIPVTGDVLVETTEYSYTYQEDPNYMAYTGYTVSNLVLKIKSLGARNIPTPPEDLYYFLTNDNLISPYYSRANVDYYDPIGFQIVRRSWGSSLAPTNHVTSSLTYAGGNSWTDMGISPADTNIYLFKREYGSGQYLSDNFYIESPTGYQGYGYKHNKAYKVSDFEELRKLAKRTKTTICLNPPFSGTGTFYEWSLGFHEDYGTLGTKNWTDLQTESETLIDLLFSTGSDESETATVNAGVLDFPSEEASGGLLFSVDLSGNEEEITWERFGSEETYNSGLIDISVMANTIEYDDISFWYPCKTALETGLVSRVYLYAIFVTKARILDTRVNNPWPINTNGMVYTYSGSSDLKSLSVAGSYNFGMKIGESEIICSPQADLPFPVGATVNQDYLEDGEVVSGVYSIENNVTPGIITQYKLVKIKEWTNPQTYPLVLEEGILGGLAMQGSLDNCYYMASKANAVLNSTGPSAGDIDTETDTEVNLSISTHIWRFIMVVEWNFTGLD